MRRYIYGAFSICHFYIQYLIESTQQPYLISIITASTLQTPQWKLITFEQLAEGHAATT